MEERHIILSIEVLTSRKEEQVRRCLASLEPLRKAVPCELIVVDTSEDDHMNKVVREYADKVIPFHWIQDFSAARNAGLREAEGEWFMYLDDDEWFVELDDLINFFKSGEYKQYNGATYIQRNYLNRIGTLWDDDWVSRMIRRRPETHFESPIHEYFEPAATISKGVRGIVDHYGYLFTSDEQRMAHFERNYPLLQKMIDEHPEDVRWRMQMMLEYNSIGRYQDLLQLGEDCLRDFSDSRDPEVINAAASFFGAKQVAYDGLKDYISALKVCREALADHRTSRMGQAYFYSMKGGYELSEKNYRQAEKDELHFLDDYRYFQQNEAQRIIEGRVPFIMQAFTEYHLLKAYSVLICAGLRQNNPKYLKRYFSKLRLDDIYVDYMYPDIPAAVISGMAEIEADKIFVKTLETLTKNEDVWEAFELELLNYVMEDRPGVDRLTALLERAGIEAGFMKLYPLRKRISENSNEIKEERLVSLLSEYASFGSSYYQTVYSEEDRIKHPDKLPADYRAALILRDIFAENDLQRRIPMLRDVVEAYPPFAEAMKSYAKYLGEQLKRESAPAASNPQLELMAQQVLENVSAMLDNGLDTEAYSVIQQLREMLPQNEEILRLEHEIAQRLQ